MTSEEQNGSIANLFRQIIDLVRRTASRNAVLGLYAILPGLVIMAVGWGIAARDTVAYTAGGQGVQPPLLELFWSFMLLGGGFVVLLLGDLWCTLAGIHIAEREHAGEYISVGDAISYVWKRFWHALGFTVVEAVVIFAYALVVGLIVIALGIPAAVLTESEGGKSIATGLFVTVAIVLVGIPIVYMIVMWAFGPNAIVIDGAGPIEAFSRSAALVKGAWWKIFFISIVLVLAYQLASMLAGEILDVVGVFGAGMADASIESDTPSLTDFLTYFGKSLDDIIEMGIAYYLAMFLVPVYSTVLYLWRRDRLDAAVVDAVADSDLGAFQETDNK